MTLALLFWVLMLLWLVLGLYWGWPAVPPPNTPGPAWRPLGGHVFLWILLLLLGWGTFGSPIK